MYIFIHTHKDTHTMERVVYEKKNRIFPFGTAWINLKEIILSEVSHTKTHTV